MHGGDALASRVPARGEVHGRGFLTVGKRGVEVSSVARAAARGRAPSPGNSSPELVRAAAEACRR